MANISIKSQKITPFGGIFHVMEKFDHYIGPVVDGELGLRCTTFGYQYSEIARSLMSVYFCGGDCVEDVTSHLMPHLCIKGTENMIRLLSLLMYQGTRNLTRFFNLLIMQKPTIESLGICPIPIPL